MTIACPAKINLTLEVLDRRADGYHTIRTVMVPLELADELKIYPSAAFTFRCSDPHIETHDNLAVRAARAVASKLDVALELDKHIPMQAGLGGGSSDAAGVLLAATRGTFGAVDADWIAVARELGSDVPFFLVESGALVEGTGERVTAIGALPPWHVLIVKPPTGVSTAAAYAQLDLRPRRSRPRSTSVSLEMVAAVQRADLARVHALLCNDFSDVVSDAVPVVAQAIDALVRAGATQPLLTGSGSAAFALAESAEAIASIAGRLDLPLEFVRISTALRRSATWRA